ncbi:hypothetical protein [Streptomyces sp. NPDC055085]
MTITDQLVGVIGGGGVTGVLAYLGIRYSSKQSSQVALAATEQEARKVDREQFAASMTRYDEERARMEERIRETERTQERTRSLLATSLRYIRILRKEMEDAGLEPTSMPLDLEEASTDFF